MVNSLGAPLQGGLPPTARGSDVLEIACDESGFSGSNLLEPSTPVFTHASVDLSLAEAGVLIARLRERVPGAREFKSAEVLRALRSTAELDWLLEELAGRAHVHVIDKELFLVTRVVDLFVAGVGYAAGTRLTQELRAPALALYLDGRAHAVEWQAFLAAFADLTRTKRRKRLDRGDAAALDRLFAARDDLLSAGLSERAADVLAGLSRSRAAAVLRQLEAGDPEVPPPLEPLLPALAETVLHWSAGGRPVLVIHDEQSALTAGRLRALQQVLALGRPDGVGPLAGLVAVDSRDDARVQVADVLAGLARRSTPAASADADADVGAALASFVSPTSLTASRQDSTR